MKRFVVFALLVLFSAPCWSAPKKITVAELKEMLETMHKDNKGDADVAAALKQVQMSEMLTRPVMDEMSSMVPGQQSTEQMYVLEARSSMLPPPAADMPKDAAPDAAAQQAMLAKAGTFADSFQQLPAMTVTRTTLRFQDNIEALAESSGMHGSAKDASTGSIGAVNPYNFIHYINSTDLDIGMDKGVERLPAMKQTDRRLIEIAEPYPGVTQVFHEATDSGTMKFERWQTVDGKSVAVFNFQVPKKKAHVAMNVCCFPSLDQTGRVQFSSASIGGAASSAGQGGGAGGAKGNLQTTTDWHPFKQNNLPYHGEIFIVPDSGAVVRVITQMELKSSDVVHQHDVRTDYAAVTVGDKSLPLPVRAMVVSEVVPNGDSGAGGYSTRTTLFSSDYKNYQLAK